MTICTWIDDPGPFDSLVTWEEYLEKLKALPEDEPIRDVAIEDAQQMIERKRREILGSI